MKNYLVILLSIITLHSPLSSAKEQIRIGVEGAFPPFSFLAQNGEIQGFDIDIAHALCAELQAECKLVAQDWDGMIPALLARKFDIIIASMTITEKRKKKVAFTNKYYQSPNKFVRRKGSGIEINQQGMQDKIIGVQRSSTSDSYISDNYKDITTIKRYANQDDAYLDMQAGRIDLLLADAYNLEDGFLNKEGGEQFEFVGPTLSNPKWFGEGNGIALRKQDNELRERLNLAIDKIRTNGVYQEIQDKYFDFNIFGS